MTTLQALVSLGDLPSNRTDVSNTGTRRRLADSLRAGDRAVRVVDVAVALVTFVIVRLAWTSGSLPDGISDLLEMNLTVGLLLQVVALAAVWSVVFHAFGVNITCARRRGDMPWWRVVAALGVCTLMLAALPLARAVPQPAGMLAVFWGSACGAFFLVHTALVVGRHHRRKLVRRRVLVAGTGSLAREVLDALSNSDEASFEVVGFVDSPDATPVDPEIASRTLGPIEGLEALLMREHVDEVFIALPVRSHYRDIEQVVSACERIGVQAKYRADIFRTEVAWPRLDPSIDQVVTLHMTQDGVGVAIKRGIDIVVSLLMLIALAPVMLAVAVAVRLSGPGPILFSQERYGLNRRRFRMLKFRTMVPNAERLQASLEQLNEADGAVFKIAADPRVTPVGRFLRRTSLDELPQLINVLRGEMSLVGPRPLPLRDVARFTDPRDMRRFSVRPGLTCLWQISGRSTLSFTEWMRLDLLYIDRWSLALDLLILARTVPAVLRGTGAH